jgi:hypothetical protein
MKVAIHQPQYWPWVPYLHKVMAADVFVYLDTVQFSTGGYQNRNQIKTAQGASWLVLPVQHAFGQRILETRIADPHVLARHWKTLKAHYSRAEGFYCLENALREFCEQPAVLLCDVAIASVEWMLCAMGIRRRCIRASTLPGVRGRGSALVASICEALGARAYLSGSGGVGVLAQEDFHRIGCSVLVQDCAALRYTQTWPGAGFLPQLSALDLILNCPDEAATLIDGSGRWSVLWGAEEPVSP